MARIRGTNGNDNIVGTTGNDNIRGRRGDDIIDGGSGDDDIFGGGGSDILFGGDGDDSLNGGGGRDALYGGAGDDNLNGGNGHDTLFWESGNDIFTGGSGNDTFVFSHLGGQPRSLVTVTDFEDGSDLLDISSFDVLTNRTIDIAIIEGSAGTYFYLHDAGAVISPIVLLENMVAADLTVDDFIL